METEPTTSELLAHEVTYPQVVSLTAYMADSGYTAQEVAYAVEKPWKHADLIAQALLSEQEQT